jgi:hypothetical protein
MTMESTALTAPKRRGNPNWVKGISGNPSGVRKTWNDRRLRLSRLDQKARTRLARLIDSENEQMAFQALTLYYAYTLGKPVDGDVLAQMDSMLTRRLEAMKALVNVLPEPSAPELPAPEAAVVTPEVVPSLPLPESPVATGVQTPASAPTGLRCIYRGKEGQCQEMAAPDGSWCGPHRAKLFAVVDR